MANERAIETMMCFQVNGAVTWFPPAVATVNGGIGQVTAATSQIADAKEVAIFGYSVTTAATSVQFNVGATPTAVVGLLFTTAAVGHFMFPTPIILRAPAGDTANLSATTVGAGTAITVYYKKLS